MTNKEAVDILRDWGDFLPGSGDVREAIDKAIETLEKPDKDDWFHRPVVDPWWNERFEEVEKALGFKLFIWQKLYILGHGFRQYGATTAEILKDLLDVDAKPLDYTKRPRNRREDFYRSDLKRIKEKLDQSGIPTRPVFFSHEDKLAWEMKEWEKLKKLSEKYMGPVYEDLNTYISETIESYDRFLLRCLEPYGITEDNVDKSVNRIDLDEFRDIGSDTVYKRYFIDGDYAFTIKITHSITDVGKGPYKMHDKYEMIIETDFTGGDCDD